MHSTTPPSPGSLIASEPSSRTPVRATRLAGAAKAHQATSGTSLGWLLSEQEGRTGREGLSEDEAARAWAEGQAMSLEQALAEAVAAAQPVARDLKHHG